MARVSPLANGPAPHHPGLSGKLRCETRLCPGHAGRTDHLPTGLRFLLRKAGENPCLSPVLTGKVLAPGEVHLTGSARLCLPANHCKRAQVKSCTECIRVDRECAYCTDEVSLRRLPTFLSPVPTRLPHPAVPHPALWPSPHLPHPRPSLRPGGCGTGKGQERSRAGTAGGWALAPLTPSPLARCSRTGAATPRQSCWLRAAGGRAWWSWRAASRSQRCPEWGSREAGRPMLEAGCLQGSAVSAGWAERLPIRSLE